MKTKKQSSVKAKRFNRVHAVCTYLREGKCRRCPAREQTPYGRGTAGCYLLAQEVINIAHHGSPWPVRFRAHVKNWRKRFNEYRE
jgi:hypothetical protein